MSSGIKFMELQDNNGIRLLLYNDVATMMSTIKTTKKTKKNKENKVKQRKQRKQRKTKKNKEKKENKEKKNSLTILKSSEFENKSVKIIQNSK